MEIHYMNQSKAYLRTKNFKKNSISSYVSRLNKAIRILKIDPEEFYSISDPDKVKQLMQDFKNHQDYKTMNKGTRDDVMTAFRRHIEAVQKLQDLKPTAKKYLKEFLTSYQAYVGGAKNKQAAIDSLLNNLVDIFSKMYSTKNFDASLLAFLNLKTKRDLTEIHKVAGELSSKEYNLIVFNHFETTAKVLALKGLIKQLNADVGKLRGDEK